MSNRQEYLNKTRDSRLQKMKEWYFNNKERKRGQNSINYCKRKDELVKQQSEYYHNNRDKILARAKAHRDKNRKLINQVAIHYGCRNKDCRWQGGFHSAQLEFHHFDPKTKQFQLGKGADYGIKSVAKEINKCVVLCACCHALFHVGLVSLDQSMLCNVNDNLEINERTENDKR